MTTKTALKEFEGCGEFMGRISGKSICCGYRVEGVVRYCAKCTVAKAKMKEGNRDSN
jgi:hypothetical protein